jgi:hypothetical protein
MILTLRKSLVPALLLGAIGVSTPAMAQLLGGGGSLGGAVGGVTGATDLNGELSPRHAKTSTSAHASKPNTGTQATSPAAPSNDAAVQATQNSAGTSNGPASSNGSASASVGGSADVNASASGGADTSGVRNTVRGTVSNARTLANGAADTASATANNASAGANANASVSAGSSSKSKTKSAKSRSARTKASQQQSGPSSTQ